MPLLPYQLSLRHTPVVIERILDEVPTDRQADPPVEGRFTLLEMVCHMADFEDVFLDRMRAALEQNVPEFASVDISQRAIDKHYASRDLREELDVFANRRRDTITFLEELTDEDLAREFVQGFGRMSIEKFVSVLAGHDLYHIEQASAYLKILP